MRAAIRPSGQQLGNKGLQGHTRCVRRWANGQKQRQKQKQRQRKLTKKHLALQDDHSGPSCSATPRVPRLAACPPLCWDGSLIRALMCRQAGRQARVGQTDRQKQTEACTHARNHARNADTDVQTGVFSAAKPEYSAAHTRTNTLRRAGVRTTSITARSSPSTYLHSDNGKEEKGRGREQGGGVGGGRRVGVRWECMNACGEMPNGRPQAGDSIRLLGFY